MEKIEKQNNKKKNRDIFTMEDKKKKFNKYLTFSDWLFFSLTFNNLSMLKWKLLFLFQFCVDYHHEGGNEKAAQKIVHNEFHFTSQLLASLYLYLRKIKSCDVFTHRSDTEKNSFRWIKSMLSECEDERKE